jgi:hypothetical protein
LSEINKLGITEAQFVRDSKILQLDRINVNGHYSPDNCRLVDPQTNMRNTRRNKIMVESAEGEVIEV